MDTDRLSDRAQYESKLSQERTTLARERTILSHIRTDFASFLFGIAIFGLFGHWASNLVGGIFLLIGAVFLVTGWLSYAKSNRRMRQLIEEFEQSRS